MSKRTQADNYGTHMTHCNQGECEGACKYGEHDTCPAMRKINHLKDLQTVSMGDIIYKINQLIDRVNELDNLHNKGYQKWQRKGR